MNTVSSSVCFVCIGSNHHPDVNMEKSFTALSGLFPDIRWSPVIISPALGVSLPVPDYHNRVAIFTTTMSISALRTCFKEIEEACGRTSVSKSSGLVPLDIDLLQYGDIILKPEDMQTPYVRQALSSL